MNTFHEFNVLTKTVADSGTPEALSSADKLFSIMIVFGKSSAQGAANAGSVFLGPSSVDGENPYEIQGGDVVFFQLRDKMKGNLKNWYADCATNGEGVVILYA